MAILEFDKEGSRLYETGVEEVALILKGEDKKWSKKVAWNGITAITESPSGAEPTALYADNIKYLNLMSAEEFGATIEAYMRPKDFIGCDGEVEIFPGVYIGQQTRVPFCLAYKTKVGSDTKANDHAYKLHIIYNCLAAPSEKAYSTINDSPEAVTFSWEVSTTPVTINEETAKAHGLYGNAVAHVVVTVDPTDKGDVEEYIEKSIYDDTTELLDPNAILAYLATNT